MTMSDELERLREEAEHLRRHLRLLSALSRRVASVLEPDSMLQEVVDAACALTSARYGALVIFDGSGESRVYLHGVTEEDRTRSSLLPTGGGDTPLSDSPPQGGRGPLPAPRATGYLDMPIREGDRLAGALYLAEKGTAPSAALSHDTALSLTLSQEGRGDLDEGRGDSQAGQFTEEDRELLALFADQAAAAIRNARLFQQEREARRKAEESQYANYESEARLQAILDNTTAIIFVKDLAGRYLLINRRYEALIGIPRQELVGKTVHELLPKESADLSWSHDREVLETQTPKEWEEQFTRDGRTATFLALRFPLWDSAGLLYRVCGILTDITERKRQEEERLMELEGLRALVETSPVGVIIVEAGSGSVFIVNSEAERILGLPHRAGYSLEQYEQAFERRRPDGRGYLEDELPFRRALRSGEAVQGEEMWFVFPDGRELLVRVNATPVYDDAGRITAAIAAVQDISGLHSLLDQPAQAPPEGGLLDSGYASDRGSTRETNEDSVYNEPVDSERAARTGWLYAVADGMGGEAVGEVASRTAIRALVDAYYQSSGGPEALASAVSAANRAVRDAAASRLQYAGMGTTLTAAVVTPGRAAVAHVGDSRAYLVRGGRARQLTEDHSWVAALVRSGALARDQMRTHRYRNVLTRALGRQEEVQVDLVERDLQEGDILVLCSDGVTGKVDDGELARVVSAQPPQQAAASLISLVKTRAGEDDASALVVRCRSVTMAR